MDKHTFLYFVKIVLNNKAYS